MRLQRKARLRLVRHRFIFVERLRERILLFFIGIFISAIGSVFSLKVAYLGLNSWDTLYYGLNLRFGLSIGFWSQLTSLILIIFNWLFTKVRPRLGTFLEMVCLGILIDIIYFSNLIPETDHLVSASIYAILGILLIGIGTGIYIAADLGAGPIDWLNLSISDKSGWSLRKVTTLTEVSTLAIGKLLGSPIHFSTITCSLVLGPVIQFSYEKTIIIFNDFNQFKTETFRLIKEFKLIIIQLSCLFLMVLIIILQTFKGNITTWVGFFLVILALSVFTASSLIFSENKRLKSTLKLTLTRKKLHRKLTLNGDRQATTDEKKDLKII